MTKQSHIKTMHRREGGFEEFSVDNLRSSKYEHRIQVWIAFDQWYVTNFLNKLANHQSSGVKNTARV